MDRYNNHVSLASVPHLTSQGIEPSQASNAVNTAPLFPSLSPVSSRVGFYVSTFQSLAGFEEKFHKEMSRVRLFYGAVAWTKQTYIEMNDRKNSF